MHPFFEAKALLLALYYLIFLVLIWLYPLDDPKISWTSLSVAKHDLLNISREKSKILIDSFRYIDDQRILQSDWMSKNFSL